MQTTLLKSRQIVLYGADSALVDVQAQAYLAAWAKQAVVSQTINVLRFEEWQYCDQALHGVSLIPEQRGLHIVFDYQLLKGRGLDLVAEYLAQPNPMLYVCFHMQGMGKRLSSQVDQVFKKWSDVVHHVQTVPHYRQADWMRSHLQQRKLQISSQGMQDLYHAFEGNIAGFKNWVAQLDYLKDDAGRVADDLLQSALMNQASYTPFKVIDALFVGDVDRFNRYMLPLQQHKPQLISLWHLWSKALRELLQWDLKAFQSGLSLQQVLQKEQVWQSKMKVVVACERRLGISKIRHYLWLSSQYEFIHKGFVTGVGANCLVDLMHAFAAGLDPHQWPVELA